MTSDGSPLRVSYGEYVYEHVAGWAPLPDGWEWNHVVGVGVDSQDNIYAYNRSAHPMIVLDKGGKIQATWGEDVFTTAHKAGFPLEVVTTRDGTPNYFSMLLVE